MARYSAIDPLRVVVIISRMLKDVVSFETIWRQLRGESSAARGIISFVRYIERKLGAEFVYNAEKFPLLRHDLADIFELAEKMRGAHVISSFFPVAHIPDEPRLCHWRARFRDAKEENQSSGVSVHSDRDALICTLAEALERHVWFEKNDYFKSSMSARVSEMSGRRILAPSRFVGLSDVQRVSKKNLLFTDEDTYLWIRGYSHVSGKDTWLPAQMVSPHTDVHTASRKNKEPFIRTLVSTGLATHPERSQALLGGALEIIERDAYIITWLNQISAPRIDIDALCAENATLSKLVGNCRRYRLKIHVMRLPSDAPACTALAVVEDETRHQPHFALGLKTHRNISHAAEKAILEALRARCGARSFQNVRKTPLPQQVHHYERVDYWASGENHKKLEFLIRGPVEKRSIAAWEHDSAAEHLERIISWCRLKNYEFVSVPLTSSRANVTPWHIEMVVMPELQPIYFTEKLPHIGGIRLSEIPLQFGYPPRRPLFTDEPHPFA